MGNKGHSSGLATCSKCRFKIRSDPVSFPARDKPLPLLSLIEEQLRANVFETRGPFHLGDGYWNCHAYGTLVGVFISKQINVDVFETLCVFKRNSFARVDGISSVWPSGCRERTLKIISYVLYLRMIFELILEFVQAAWDFVKRLVEIIPFKIFRLIRIFYLN